MQYSFFLSFIFSVKWKKGMRGEDGWIDGWIDKLESVFFLPSVISLPIGSSLSLSHTHTHTHTQTQTHFCSYRSHWLFCAFNQQQSDKMAAPHRHQLLQQHHHLQRGCTWGSHSGLKFKILQFVVRCLNECVELVGCSHALQVRILWKFLHISMSFDPLCLGL